MFRFSWSLATEEVDGQAFPIYRLVRAAAGGDQARLDSPAPPSVTLTSSASKSVACSSLDALPSFPTPRVLSRRSLFNLRHMRLLPIYLVLS